MFGIGGSSLMARSLGAGDSQKAKRAASFSFWTSTGVALLYGVALALLQPVLLPLVGA